MQVQMPNVQTTQPDVDLEEEMKEYTTDPNYRNIPELMPPYLKVQLWKPQYQCIHWMCNAEYAPPAFNENGDLFYSRIGLLANPTGTGKTVTAMGVCCFDVPEPLLNDVILTTSLNTILLKKKLLPIIQCTVICSDEKIIESVWMKDIQKFYDQRLSYYRFENVSSFEKSIRSLPEYHQKFMFIEQITGFMHQWNAALQSGSVTQDQFEITMIPYGDIKNLTDINIYIGNLNEELEELFDNLVVRELHKIMSSVRIFFVTVKSFHYLFKLFEHYRVARLMLDEWQSLTIENQANFEKLKTDPRIKKMRSLGIGRSKVYCEENPFLFIWIISATPELINGNTGNHYLNEWVYRNDFLITDYSTNFETKRMFPEMSKQYVVKMPISYYVEMRPDFNVLFKDYTLKAKKNAIAAILTGVLGDDFDELLENDDFEGIIAKLNNGGSVNTLLTDAQRRLELDIKKHEMTIMNYDPKTPKHVIEKSLEELKKEKKNLEDLKKKIARFHGQHASGTLEECPICFDDLEIVPRSGMDPKKICLAHMSCMGIFHTGCIGDYMKANKNALCPNCRGELSEENLKPTYDVNGYNISQQVQVEEMQPKENNYTIDTEKEYDSKIDALKAALGPMMRTVNGQSSWYRRQRALLFLQLKSEDNGKLAEIIAQCQDCGFNVMLPFQAAKSIAALNTKYPPRNGCVVTQKSKDINKDMVKYNNHPGAVIWIFRSVKDSAGLNFQSADTLIMYSLFEHKTQIRGRVYRLNKVTPCDIFTIVNV